jgi:rhodanese-related sulfurtransferase
MSGWADEFNGPLGHIAGATNIPLAELPQRLTEINAREGQAVIMVCRTDKRSAQAASILEQAGRQKPRILHGGMEAWNRNGLTTVKEGARK